MAMRSLIAFAVVLALQALAGCGKSAESGVARDERSASPSGEFETRESRLRRQVEAGTFGLAQLHPGGKLVDPRHLRPLPRPSAVPMLLARSILAETPMDLASTPVAEQADRCDYKPVMSDAELDACR
jgi:hypothetical protein